MAVLPLLMVILLLSGILQINSANIDMEEEEVVGLFEVIGSLLEDPSWGQVHPQPCTDTPWPGVQCEIGQDPPLFHVTKLHIGPDITNPPCKSSSKLPQSLSKLRYLKTLSIFGCFLTYPQTLSPSLFGSHSLSNLEHLAISSNPSLSGPIPSSLYTLSNLRILCLSQNNLEGQIPLEMGNLLNLKLLDLSYNALMGKIPNEIKALKSLAILDLSWNGLEGQVPYSVGLLESLQKLDLSFNRLTRDVPPSLGQVKALTLLDLSHNLITGPIPETMSGLMQLEYFNLDHNPINSGLPSFTGSLTKLKSLSLSSCGMTGTIPNSFSSLNNLTSLSLDNNALTGSVPPSLGTLPSLDHLNLSHNQLSGELQFSEEFINRLGERLDVKGNGGICTRKKKKNIVELLETHVCLGEKREKSWAEEQHSDGSVKPSFISGKSSSNAPLKKHPNLAFTSFLLCCLL